MCCRILLRNLLALASVLVTVTHAVTDTAAIDGQYLTAIVERLAELELRDAIREKENDDARRRMTSLERTVASQAQEIDSLKMENRKLNIRVQEWSTTDDTKLGIHERGRMRRENEEQVAFFAALSSHIENPGVHQLVAFDHVVTNIGNAYNSHAGDFRAPVAGTYEFSVTLTAADRTLNYHYGVYWNGALVSRLSIVGGGSGSQQVVLDLSQGDDVAIQHLDAGQRTYGHLYTTFSGFLITQNYTLPGPAGASAVIG